MNLFGPKRLTDVEIVAGLQAHSPFVEKYFFDISWRYFDIHFTQLFFDRDSKQEIFQSAIIKLWTEIENGKIKLIDGKICRCQEDRSYREMTATLSTFMMAFAKNEFRELLRDYKIDDLEELNREGRLVDMSMEEAVEEDEYKIQVIDECIMSMSPNCVEIITLFYYQKKNLDEIIALRGERNSSKDGLKTAKNKCMVTLRKRVMEKLNNDGNG